MKAKPPATRLTNAQLEQRLTVLEGMMSRCNWKELPGINATYQKVLAELVRRDLEQKESHERRSS